MISEHFKSHYRTLPSDDLKNMIAMAPMMAEANAAPTDWKDRIDSAKAVLEEREGPMNMLEPLHHL